MTLAAWATVKNKKTLLIRFSSLGDVTQTLSVAYQLSSAGHEVHWSIRQDLINLVQSQSYITQIWPLEKKQGLRGLIQLIKTLQDQNFDYCYDAHRSLRSFLILWGLKIANPQIKILKRPLSRFRRWLWIQFKWPMKSGPRSAQLQLLAPLEKWGVSTHLPKIPIFFIPTEIRQAIRLRIQQLGFSNYIVLVPSAAHALKRWNLKNWEQLIDLLPRQQFIILGGPEDSFLQNLLTPSNQNRVTNLAGQLNLLESAAVLETAQLVISNDTGLMHIAEQLNRPTIALMGPAPFGYPAYPTTRVLEWDLACRPCSKHGQGPCTNPVFQACLQMTTPQLVYQEIQSMDIQND